MTKKVLNNNENIEWSGFTWLKRHRWGAVHDDPEKRVNCWFDPEQVTVNGKGQMVLSINPSPRMFNINGEEIMVEYGVGTLSSLQEFQFGRFEIEARLPMGIGLWPAFWMYNPIDARAEIDVFEGYSKTNDYKNCGLRRWNVQSCIHREEGLDLKPIPARSPWIWQFNTNPSENFNVYAFEWHRYYMKFFINGKLIRIVSDPDLMFYFSYHKMHVILNTHVDGHFENNFTSDTPFVINYFRYETI